MTDNEYEILDINIYGFLMACSTMSHDLTLISDIIKHFTDSWSNSKTGLRDDKDIPDDWVCPVCGVGKDQFEIQK
ncbi:MAG: rubredoxin [Candidatus Homeothermus sp.]|nr:rubredoxin [Candidatus Homeothermus sp.]